MVYEAIVHDVWGLYSVAFFPSSMYMYYVLSIDLLFDPRFQIFHRVVHWVKVGGYWFFIAMFLWRGFSVFPAYCVLHHRYQYRLRKCHGSQLPWQHTRLSWHHQSCSLIGVCLFFNSQVCMYLQIYWNVGCQMAALNFQTPDMPLQLNMQRFEVNGGTGWECLHEYM